MMRIKQLFRRYSPLQVLISLSLTFYIVVFVPSIVKASHSQEVDVTSVESGPIAGGYWIRGYQWAWPLEQIISEYKHYTKRSHASVVNGNGTYHSGGWTKSSNQFSRAKANWIPWGTNKAYYDSKK